MAVFSSAALRAGAWLLVVLSLAASCGARERDGGARGARGEHDAPGSAERRAEVEGGSKAAIGEFVAAARSGDLETIERLLDQGAVVANGTVGADALAMAYFEGQTEVAARLEAAGADLDVRDPSDRTPLVRAVEHGRQGMVRAIIAHGGDLESVQRTGETALMVACRHGEREIVKALIRAGADVEARDNDGWTPLMFAVRAASYEVAMALLRRDADVEAASDLGWTPLMLAATDGRPDLVSLLLEGGADASRRTAMQPPPLVRAVQFGHDEAARLLVAAGADAGEGQSGDARWWAGRRKDPELSAALVEPEGGRP
jgi:ankyrin repeat protein